MNSVTPAVKDSPFLLCFVVGPRMVSSVLIMVKKMSQHTTLHPNISEKETKFQKCKKKNRLKEMKTDRKETEPHNLKTEIHICRKSALKGSNNIDFCCCYGMRIIRE